MIARALFLLASCCCAIGPVGAIDLRERSDSRQFAVYCPDAAARRRVVSFAEEVKADVLQLLGESDHWKHPIVITVERASPGAAAQPVPTIRLIENELGLKIHVAVQIGDDPAAINFPKLIARAVLLEYEYRDGGVQVGTRFVEPPRWVVEGIIQIARRRETGTDSDLFRKIIDTNKLPALDHFLVERPEELGATAQAVDAACSLCLVQLLIDQPNGRDSLAHFIREWPKTETDPAAALLASFPGLATGKQTLQKWWTLNLARLAAADRYKGLSAEDTETSLAPLLQVDLPIDKAGTRKTFAVNEFEKFIKLPASRPALAARRHEVIALSTRANALMKPVLSEYEQLFAQLARGKTRGVRERLALIEEYRAAVVHRIADIGDYLNWFEATQMGSRSGAFDSYLKVANEISEHDRKRSDPISRYLDSLEREY
jgi:hypothetical protein